MASLYRGARFSHRLSGIDHILIEDFNLSPLQIGGVTREHGWNHSPCLINRYYTNQDEEKGAIDEVRVQTASSSLLSVRWEHMRLSDLLKGTSGYVSFALALLPVSVAAPSYGINLHMISRQTAGDNCPACSGLLVDFVPLTDYLCYRKCANRT